MNHELLVALSAKRDIAEADAYTRFAACHGRHSYQSTVAA
jgi:hypothetical protein